MQQTTDKQLLANKTILVTGAGDGLGKAAAIAYAEQGATVILCGKSQSSLDAVYDQIEAAGNPQPAVLEINFETATPVDYQNLAELLDNEFGKLDGLLINAGWLGQASSLSQYDVENWYKVMQINLNAPFLLTRILLPLLNKADSASIVFTLDEKNSAYWGAYGVSKAGLESYMKILADELDSDSNSIRVNAVKPERVRTKLRMKAYPGEDPNTLPQPAELMDQFIFLMSNDSNKIHGEIIKL